MLDYLLKAFRSQDFNRRLEIINKCYPNLKQELHIRNALLEILNTDVLPESQKAFAEHPRDKGSRVDLSIVERDKKEEPYLIEFKFQYTNDFKMFLDYERFIHRDFGRTVHGKQTDAFILIVSYWNKDDKHKFDEEWGIKSELSRFLSLNEAWRTNIAGLFSKFTEANLTELTFNVKEPYETYYEFFIINRVSKV